MKKRETFSAVYQKQTTLCTPPAIQGDLKMNSEVLDLDLGWYHIVSAVLDRSKVV